LNAVVLGGGKTGDPFPAGFGVPVKALIPIADRPMAWYVLRALRESGKVDRIVYIGPTTPALEPLIDVNVPDAGGMLENLEAGLARLQAKDVRSDGRVLLATADVPLLTANAVRDLFERDPGAALVYPVVPEGAAERQFPGGKRTYARVLEGRFTGGNLFVLEPGLVGQFMPRLRQVIANRKNPVALAGVIGLGTLFKLLLGRLSIPDLEARVSHILGVPARALITEAAEIGFDVDKPEDLELVRARIK
jgi:molybdopterin-guanine dinucleotide biosynthesis protein A